MEIGGQKVKGRTPLVGEIEPRRPKERFFIGDVEYEAESLSKQPQTITIEGVTYRAKKRQQRGKNFAPPLEYTTFIGDNDIGHVRVLNKPTIDSSILTRTLNNNELLELAEDLFRRYPAFEKEFKLRYSSNPGMPITVEEVKAWVDDLKNNYNVLDVQIRSRYGPNTGPYSTEPNVQRIVPDDRLVRGIPFIETAKSIPFPAQYPQYKIPGLALPVNYPQALPFEQAKLYGDYIAKVGGAKTEAGKEANDAFQAGEPYNDFIAKKNPLAGLSSQQAMFQASQV